MRSPVFFDKEGAHQVAPEKTIEDIAPSKPYTVEYGGGLLIIDTFNNSLEWIPKDLYEDIFVRNDTTNEYYGHYQNRFGRSIKRIKDNLENDLGSKKRSTSVIPCLSYDCNCRCIYCYQQKNITDRRRMDVETLKKVLSFADNKFSDGFSEDNTIELFGGEPFLSGNRDLIETILAYCREKKVAVGFTSNLVQMWDYAPLLLKYRGYICNVYTTIDGGRESHNSRRISLVGMDPFSDIVRNVNFLMDCEIPVTVSFNIDWKSLERFDEFLEVAKENGWYDNSRITLEIGRVDDRFYEGCADDIMMESELLEEIVKRNKARRLPSNIKLAFLKTTKDIAEMLGISFNQTEYGRSRYNYCWASSPIDRVYYVDKDLNAFRCTYTVGKQSERIGSIEGDVPDVPDNYLLSSEECLSCNIGGYCAGGCANSRKRDKKRMCEEERRNFDHFVRDVVIPRIDEIMGGSDA